MRPGHPISPAPQESRGYDTVVERNRHHFRAQPALSLDLIIPSRRPSTK